MSLKQKKQSCIQQIAVALMLHLDFPSDLNSRYDISFCYASTPSSTPWRLIDPLRFPVPPFPPNLRRDRILSLSRRRRDSPGAGRDPNGAAWKCLCGFLGPFWNIRKSGFGQNFAEIVGPEKKKGLLCWYLEPENWTIMNSVTVSGWLLHLLSSACGQEPLAVNPMQLCFWSED